MIVLPTHLSDAVKAQGVATYPDESGGFLLGHAETGPGDKPVREVTQLAPIDNARDPADRFHRFRVEPEDYLAVELDAAARGLDVVGFYHSHPDHPAEPSDYDRDHALPNWSYVVVAVDGSPWPGGLETAIAGDLTSWELAADRSHFLPEPIRPTR
jgi:proteasome lid subunit RPN8/RPN11